MADPPGHSDTSGTPRWVKVFGLTAIVLVLLFLILVLTGRHRPRRHTPSGGGGAHTPRIEHVVEQP